MTRTYVTTPRYESYTESKIMARAGASTVPTGAGTSATTRSSSASTPTPVLAETLRTSSGSQPMRLASSAANFSGWAAGRSILFSTGMILRSFSIARYRLARVWASMPWAASTRRTVPSQAASDRETS